MQVLNIPTGVKNEPAKIPVGRPGGKIANIPVGRSGGQTTNIPVGQSPPKVVAKKVIIANIPGQKINIIPVGQPPNIPGVAVPRKKATIIGALAATGK